MKPYIADADFTLYVGDVRDVLQGLPDESVHCCVTSPPYWGLRDYGVDGQLGLEASPEEYVAAMVDVFREVRRVLRRDGTLWLNIGDSYVAGQGGRQSAVGEMPAAPLQRTNVPRERDDVDTGSWASRDVTAKMTPARGSTFLKPKDLVGVPWRLAFALQADGWWLRSDVIWSKPNPMPESVADRPTKAHEYLFLLTKSSRYFYDADAIREPAEFGYSPSSGNEWRQGVGSAMRDPERGSRTVTRGSDLLARRRQAETLDGSSGEAPRGADGRRQTHVVGRDGSAQHRDGDRWPNGLNRNKRTVWEIATEPYPDAHFATFPQALVEPCVKAGCPVGGTVLDPFMGSGTTALVARRLGRHSIGVELNPEYAAQCAKRLSQLSLLAEGAA